MFGNFYFSSPFQGQTGVEGNTSKSDIFFAPLCVPFSHLTLKNPGAGSFHPICSSLRKGDGERKEICIFSRFLSFWGRCFQVEWAFSKVWTEDSVRSDIRGGSRLSSTYKPNICAGKWPVSMFVASVIWLSQQRTDERWNVYIGQRGGMLFKTIIDFSIENKLGFLVRKSLLTESLFMVVLSKPFRPRHIIKFLDGS